MNTPLHQVDLRYTKEELLTIYAVATTLGNYSPFPKIFREDPFQDSPHEHLPHQVSARGARRALWRDAIRHPF